MKKTDVILLSGLIGAILFTNFAGFESKIAGFEREVLRMHILANSDSKEDQELKIKVRDELLSHSDEIFSGCADLDDMKEAAEENLEYINNIALGVISENGFDYGAESNIVNMEFDERVYGDITMPAGNYDALRITIGEAKGHNWWCVMYPPLCIPAAECVESDTSAAQEYFSAEEMNVLENPQEYKAGFKCAEMFRSLKKKIAEIW